MRRDEGRKKPLYRKVNTRARGVHHDFGGDFKNSRGSSKKPDSKMKRKVKRGLDYTPLFKFLLSKVGKEWAPVHSEAVSRLDSEDAISYMVRMNDHMESYESYDYFNYGEATIFSKLCIDEDGILRKVNPDLTVEDFTPWCPCCTHTFNGSVLVKKYKEKEK
jgi:hypothetical protein